MAANVISNILLICNSLLYCKSHSFNRLHNGGMFDVVNEPDTLKNALIHRLKRRGRRRHHVSGRKVGIRSGTFPLIH